ncbi:hypothetical protein HXX76_010668 [Chlamydomonas incerta]|uniref:Uncharacterized protein n=1 Tax=Chlamydomonas incerta TaxID=51695 RepID=A0A835SUA5_CHLIN|nr:hypothetical protein HXX76_010668 [Chlamydomonas incerta]|eukprot:KAG2429888.1 hypothetical protein HXX76_010668 [Chlamydomonas incerta]
MPSREPSGWTSIRGDLKLKIASYVHPNEATANLKLVDRDTAKSLSNFRIIHLAQLVPEWFKISGKGYFGCDEIGLSAQPWPGAEFVRRCSRPGPWRSLCLPQRQRMLCLAASSGDAPSLEVALEQCGCSLEPEVAMMAAAAGAVAACKVLLIRQGGNLCDYFIDVAAEAGRLEVLQWYRTQELARRLPRLNGSQLDYAAAAACRGGHEHVMDWFFRTYGAASVTPGRGRRPCLLYINDCRTVTRLAAAAAAGGHAALFESYAPRLSPRAPLDVLWPALMKLALGCCPLPVLQRWHDLDGRLQPSAELKALMVFAAACSPSPDWAAKVTCLLAQQPAPRGLQPQPPQPPQPAGAAGPEEGAPAEADLHMGGGGGATEFPPHVKLMDDIVFSWLGEQPDLQQRVELLASRGLVLTRYAYLAEFTARACNVAALEWMIDRQRLELTDALVKRLVGPRGAPEPVLELLRARGYVFGLQHVREALRFSRVQTVGWLARLLDGQRQQQQQGGNAAAFWSNVFRQAAALGASLDTLRYLHEQHDAQIDLKAVATGGSVEALEWAVRGLRRGCSAAAARRGGDGSNLLEGGGTATAGTCACAASAAAGEAPGAAVAPGAAREGAGDFGGYGGGGASQQGPDAPGADAWESSSTVSGSEGAISGEDDAWDAYSEDDAWDAYSSEGGDAAGGGSSGADAGADAGEAACAAAGGGGLQQQQQQQQPQDPLAALQPHDIVRIALTGNLAAATWLQQAAPAGAAMEELLLQLRGVAMGEARLRKRAVFGALRWWVQLNPLEVDVAEGDSRGGAMPPAVAPTELVTFAPTCAQWWTELGQDLQALVMRTSAQDPITPAQWEWLQCRWRLFE